MSDTEKTRKGFNYRKLIIPSAIILGTVGALGGLYYLNNLKNEFQKQNEIMDELAWDIEKNLMDATLYDYGNTQTPVFSSPRYSPSSSTVSTRTPSPPDIYDFTQLSVGSSHRPASSLIPIFNPIPQRPT